MKVYCVFMAGPFDDNELIEICGTQERARRLCDNLFKNEELSLPNIYFYEEKEVR